jgi:hypothetical protein
MPATPKTAEPVTTEILSREVQDMGVSVDVRHGKTRAVVTVFDDGDIWVTGENASHRAWKGSGKCFADVEQALNHYRSDATRAVISAAAAEFAKKPDVSAVAAK